jgi:hypothetical protein
MEEAICRRVIVLPSTKAHGSSLDWFCESSMRKAMAACTGSRQSNAALSKGSIGIKTAVQKDLLTSIQELLKARRVFRFKL